MINMQNKYLVHLLLICTVVLFQIYFPIISIKSLQIQPDIILLYITVIAILFGRFPAIVIGFILGLIQDFSTQAQLLGVLSLSKSIAAYLLASIYNYKTIWSRRVQYGVIFISYIIHFFIYFYLFSRTIFDLYYLLIFILLHSIIVFLLLLLCEKLVFKNKLL